MIRMQICACTPVSLLSPIQRCVSVRAHSASAISPGHSIFLQYGCSTRSVLWICRAMWIPERLCVSMSIEATDALSPVWTNTIPLHHIMLQDVLGSLAAVLAFAAVLYAPGYLVAYTTNVFQFRRMAFAERSIWAIACSFCVAPIAAYLLGRSAGLSGIAWLLAGCTLANLAAAGAQERPAGLVSPRHSRNRAVGGWMDCVRAADAGRFPDRPQAFLHRGDG